MDAQSAPLDWEHEASYYVGVNDMCVVNPIYRWIYKPDLASHDGTDLGIGPTEDCSIVAGFH